MRTNLLSGSKKLLLILILLIGGLSVSALTRSDSLFGPFGLLSGAFFNPGAGSIPAAVTAPAAPSRSTEVVNSSSASMFVPQTIVDDQGADDEPGQKDLNSMTVDFGDPGSETFNVLWNWDDTATSGANTRDGGALFDTDGDGFANYSLYITVDADGTFVPQLFICTADSREDRCGGPAEDTSFASFPNSVTVVANSDPFGVAGSPFFTSTHLQNNDCDDNPACNTADTVADITAVLSDFGNPEDIVLLNVCSYPSGEPNSDPSDCVVDEPPGSLKLIKVVENFGESGEGYLEFGDFPLSINGNLTTSGTPVSVVAGDYTIAETPQTGYLVGTWTCTDGTTGTAGSASATVNVASRETVTCTMTNTLIADPSIDLVKTASTANFSNPPVAGDKITYTFDITNDGNVTLTGVDLDDALVNFDNATCTVTTLAPGASTQCTADYTLTQADINSGSVTNIADACGDPPTGAGSEVCDTDTTTTNITQVKSIDLEKVATTTFSTPPVDGDTIKYDFEITNTGNVTLTGVDLDDALVNFADATCEKTTLIPGEKANCSATYTLTQADVDAGFVTNNADACGDPPSGSEVCDTDTTTTNITQVPHLAITKVATEQSYDAVGDVINYTIVATNDGNVTLHNVTVTDPKVTGLTCTPANGSSLAPDESMTCTATHTIEQADLDAGHYANTACVDDGAGGAAEVCADEDVPADGSSSIELVKTGTFNDENGDSNADPGETISYAFSVKNTGNVTLTNVTLADVVSGVTVSGGPIASLAPQATDTTTFTGSYAVTQADIDAGLKDNTAEACGEDPDEDPADVCDQDDETVNLPQDPGLSISKVATQQSYDAVNDVINYTIIATNIGNTTLNSVTVTDSVVSNLVCVPANGSSLAPGASMTCTATHTIVQADIDAGHFANIACVDDGPAGAPQVCDGEDVPLAALNIEKASTTIVIDSLGQVVPYTYVVTNTGNITLTSVSLVDDKVSGGDIDCTPSQPATLAPGDTMECTGSYTVTQADIDAETPLVNIATADSDQTGPDTDTVSIPINLPDVGHLFHTGVTCSDFTSGLPGLELESAEYVTKANKVNNVAPGVMFYYGAIVAPAASFKYNLTQSNDAGWKVMPVQGTNQIILYTANCGKLNMATSFNAAGTATINVVNATPFATYIVGIKYSLSGLSGQAVAPPLETATYSFSADIDGNSVGSSEDSIPIFPKQ